MKNLVITTVSCIALSLPVLAQAKPNKVEAASKAIATKSQSNTKKSPKEQAKTTKSQSPSKDSSTPKSINEHKKNDKKSITSATQSIATKKVKQTNDKQPIQTSKKDKTSSALAAKKQQSQTTPQQKQTSVKPLEVIAAKKTKQANNFKVPAQIIQPNKKELAFSAKRQQNLVMLPSKPQNTATQKEVTQPSTTSSLLYPQALIANAKQYIGLKYRYGGSSPSTGFDCSGFVSYIYKKTLGITLPRRSRDMAQVGKLVSRANLELGDIVFFGSSRNNISHVGMYVGNDQFIHSPSTGKSITITSLNTNHYKARFQLARRMV